MHNNTLNNLESRIAHIEMRLGIDGEWITPNEAAKLRIVPISANMIKAEIREAEKRRALDQPTDLEYGTHYFNTAAQGDRPAYKIHSTKFWDVVKKHPSERV